MGILKSILEYINGAEVAGAAKLSVDGKCGKNTVKALQKYLGVTQDGVISGQNAALKRYHPALTAVKYGKGGSTTVKTPCPLPHRQVDSSPLDHQAGKSLHSLLKSSTPKQSTSSSNSLDHHD